MGEDACRINAHAAGEARFCDWSGIRSTAGRSRDRPAIEIAEAVAQATEAARSGMCSGTSSRRHVPWRNGLVVAGGWWIGNGSRMERVVEGRLSAAAIWVLFVDRDPRWREEGGGARQGRRGECRRLGAASVVDGGGDVGGGAATVAAQRICRAKGAIQSPRDRHGRVVERLQRSAGLRRGRRRARGGGRGGEGDRRGREIGGGRSGFQVEVVCRGGKRRGSRCRDGIVLLLLVRVRMLWRWFWLLRVDDVRRRHCCPVQEAQPLGLEAAGAWGRRQLPGEIMCFVFFLFLAG